MSAAIITLSWKTVLGGTVANVPAGWYPNPDGSDSLLFWNGETWMGDPQTREQIAASQQTGGGHSAPAHKEVKVGFFGGKKAAQAFSDEAEALKQQVAELQSVISKYGIEDDARREAERKALSAQIQSLNEALVQSQAQLGTLNNQIALLSETLVNLRSVEGLQSFGLYDFEHAAESSVALAGELDTVRSQIKQMVSTKSATSAVTNFMFNNSASEGAKFVRDMSALLLRAYNAEAENCVKGAKAGNQDANVKRLTTAMTQIERQGSMIGLRIAPAFHALRLREIDIATKHLKALEVEKAAEADRKARLREEAKVAREIERENRKLLNNKKMIEEALQAAQERGDTDGIERYTNQLAEVNDGIEKVNALAANSRMGHVYVISNIGAFGADVVKIGMTRRMDPNDRVRELGDASVPFRFDVHAMIFSDDAVGLETALHHAFEPFRVNKVNAHREFFRVTPEMVLAELQREKVLVVSYELHPEALEYRASKGDSAPNQAIIPDDFINEEFGEEEDK